VKLLLSVLGLAVITLSAAATEPSLTIDESVYKADETIAVTFAVPAGIADAAWVGIIPSSIPHGDESENDNHDITYQYLSGRTSGTLSFEAPPKPGAWDLRLHDGQGAEVAFVPFEVMTPSYSDAKMTIPDTIVTPGASIPLQFKAPDGLARTAWIGLIPSSVPHGDEEVNDAHDIAYQYLERTSGTLTFAAPEIGGAYDFRMHSADKMGIEVASVSFRVQEPSLAGAVMKIAKSTYIPGEAMSITYEAPEGLSPRAWIGIVPAAIPHGSEAENDAHNLGWHYMDGETQGVLDFRAPVDPGDYTFRMHNRDDDGEEIASLPFSVKAIVGAEDLHAQLESRGRVAVYGIRFETGSAKINAESAAALEQIALLLESDPALRLRIEGHTDSVGDEAYNLDLSNRRAASVKAHLVEVHGVIGSRLTTVGFGETKPVGDNETPAGRAQNRRVELARP